MTRPVLICVTGSRALVGHDDARAWLRSELDARRPAVVVTGTLPAGRLGAWSRARHPDQWAAEWCRETATAALVFELDGMTYDAEGRELREWTNLARPSTADAPAWRRWPLARNAAMVADVGRATHYDVTVLALRSEGSRTQGTAHTAGLARAAGLTVVERVFTREPTLRGVI